jgi:5'-deoxynucleotidase
MTEPLTHNRPLAPLYLSASVQRYHHNPVMARTGQTNGDHQGRCVLLLLALHPGPSVALLRATATHDVGELVAGDLGLPFKRAAPDLARRHARVEKDAREAIFGDDLFLTEEDESWLRLVDRLESHCWCLHVLPQEYHRPNAGWLRAEPGLFNMAAALGCEMQVRGLIHDLKAGNW